MTSAAATTTRAHPESAHPQYLTIAQSRDGYVPTFGLDRLTPPDVGALCRYFRLPLPTPDVPLSAILADAGLTPADVYVRLERTTDIRLMIAASLLRQAHRRTDPSTGATVTVLPPDPRLRPRPHAASRIAPSATRTEAESARAAPPPPLRPARATRAPPSATRRVASVQPNPKKVGSAAHARYRLYRVGASEADLIAAGLRREDFSWDSERGHVVWVDDAGGAPGSADPTDDASPRS